MRITLVPLVKPNGKCCPSYTAGTCTKSLWKSRTKSVSPDLFDYVTQKPRAFKLDDLFGLRATKECSPTAPGHPLHQQRPCFFNVA